MPGSTPWASASPKNASPRTTTHVPTSAVVAAASSPPTSARWVMPDEKASVTKSISAVLRRRGRRWCASCRRRSRPRALVAEALGEQLDHLDVADLVGEGVGELGGPVVSAKIAGTPASRIAVGQLVEVGGRRLGAVVVVDGMMVPTTSKP